MAVASTCPLPTAEEATGKSASGPMAAIGCHSTLPSGHLRFVSAGGASYEYYSPILLPVVSNDLFLMCLCRGQSHQAASGQVAEATGVKAGSSQCSNCLRFIPTGQAQMHSLHCARNNTHCPVCDRVVRKVDMQHHWHCGVCIDVPFSTDTVRGRAKHEDIYHTPITCECGTVAELRDLLEVSSHV